MTAAALLAALPQVLPLDVRNAIDRCAACRHPGELHFVPARRPWPCRQCNCAAVSHEALVLYAERRAAIGRIALPASLRAAVIARDGMRCRYCTRRVHLRRGPGRLHIDHVQPYVLVGRHAIDNLVVSCQRCNLAKGADPTIRPQPLATEAA